MTRRTRSWRFVAQDAGRLAKLGLSAAEIARRLGMNKSTVSRWIKDGKLEITKAPPVAIGARLRQSPAEWAVEVRAAYDLDATDDQLVTIGEQAIEISRDPQVSPQARMSAAGRFQSIVRQLNLVARRIAAANRGVLPEPEPEAPRRFQVVRRTPGVDPRERLMEPSE